MNRSSGVTALLGMPGFVFGAQLEVDGEGSLSVETTADVVSCPDAARGRAATAGDGSGCATCPSPGGR